METVLFRCAMLRGLLGSWIYYVNLGRFLSVAMAQLSHVQRARWKTLHDACSDGMIFDKASGEHMLITDEWLMRHRTERGGWTRAQIESLGLQWPATVGWKKRLIGHYLTKDQAQAFIDAATKALPHHHARNTRRAEQRKKLAHDGIHFDCSHLFGQRGQNYELLEAARRESERQQRAVHGDRKLEGT